jgi:hypothetical protein
MMAFRADPVPKAILIDEFALGGPFYQIGGEGWHGWSGVGRGWNRGVGLKSPGHSTPSDRPPRNRPDAQMSFLPDFRCHVAHVVPFATHKMYGRERHSGSCHGICSPPSAASRPSRRRRASRQNLSVPVACASRSHASLLDPCTQEAPRLINSFFGMDVIKGWQAGFGSRSPEKHLSFAYLSPRAICSN